MSRRAEIWAGAQTAGGLTLRATLDKLAWLADGEGRVCVTQGDLAARLECEDRTVRNSLKTLERAGLIRREARYRADKSRCADVIILALDAAGERSGR